MHARIQFTSSTSSRSPAQKSRWNACNAAASNPKYPPTHAHNWAVVISPRCAFWPGSLLNTICSDSPCASPKRASSASRPRRSRGDPKTAVQLYSENLKIVPHELRSFALLWSALVDAGQLEPAEKMVADLRRRRPDAVILTEIANMAVEKKMLVEALDLYMQAIQSNPRYKPVYVQSGILLANLNHLDRAIGLWQKALALDPSDRQVVRLIARARELQAGLNTNAADKPISNNGEKQ